jgi:hypothetical protein
MNRISDERIDRLRAGQSLITVNERQLVFPAASDAVITMVVDPTYSGMAGVLQLVVPLAVPVVPSDVAHVTDVTPTLSVAVPLTTRALADVA